MIWLGLYLRGLAMGVADLIPGVSGGTIALIAGIYERLINAIAAVDGVALGHVFKGRIARFWQHIDGWFLLTVLAGILTSLVLLAGGIKYLLSNHPLPTWSFFFGLILASALLLIKHIKQLKATHVLALLAGFALGAWVSLSAGVLLPDDHWAFVLAGAIAVSAMILPGISGSLLLILIGKYAAMLEALHSGDALRIGLFIVGALIGLVIFSRLIKWALARHHDAMIAALSGLMLGSLIKVWPWKIADGNVWPWQHEAALLWQALPALIAGVVVIVLFERAGRGVGR